MVLCLVLTSGLLWWLPALPPPAASRHMAPRPAHGVTPGTAAFAALEAVTHNASLERFSWFDFTLGFGLQNNLAVLRYQHLGAKWAARTLVLPATMPSRGRSVPQVWDHSDPYHAVLVNAAEQQWRPVPLELILDVDYLRACTTHLGMRTLTAAEAEAQGVPPPVPVEHGYNVLAAVHRSLEDPRASTSHNFITMGHEIITKHPEMHAQIHAFDGCLSYSPELYRVAELMAASIHTRFGVSVGDMVTLHSRMEDDMLSAASEVGSIQYNYGRMLGKVQACLAAVAPPSAGRPLFVPTGETFSNPKYDWFRQAYGDLAFSTEHLESSLIEDLRFRQGLDAGTGVIDLLLAQESGVFVGCLCSSFSVRIAQYRFKLGRPSYMLNGERGAGLRKAASSKRPSNVFPPPPPSPLTPQPSLATTNL